jgi:hypothetical protein
VCGETFQGVLISISQSDDHLLSLNIGAGDMISLTSATSLSSMSPRYGFMTMQY